MPKELSESKKGSRLADWQLAFILTKLRQAAPIAEIAEYSEVSLDTIYRIRRERRQMGETFPEPRLRDKPLVTDKQLDTLLLILGYYNKYRRYPHIRLLAKIRGVSLEATHNILLKLKEKGLVNWPGGRGKPSPVKVTRKGRIIVSLSDKTITEVVCPSQTQPPSQSKS